MHEVGELVPVHLIGLFPKALQNIFTLRPFALFHLHMVRLATESRARRSMFQAMLANKEIFWFYVSVLKF